MKKTNILLILLLFSFTSVEAKTMPNSATKIKYMKEITYNNLDIYAYNSNYSIDNNVIELTKNQYESELNSIENNNTINTLVSKTDTTTYKRLIISYEPTSGGKYIVTAKVDWDVMPAYRRIDHLGTTHMVSSVFNIKTGTMTYTKGGSTSTLSQNNAVLSYNEYWYSYGQIVDHDLPDDDIFSSVSDIKFQISYEVLSNPASNLCAVIYHQDTSTASTQYLARYFYGNGDIRLGNTNMETLYSVQKVCF